VTKMRGRWARAHWLLRARRSPLGAARRAQDRRPPRAQAISRRPCTNEHFIETPIQLGRHSDRPPGRCSSVARATAAATTRTVRKSRARRMSLARFDLTWSEYVVLRGQMTDTGGRRFVYESRSGSAPCRFSGILNRFRRKSRTGPDPRSGVHCGPSRSNMASPAPTAYSPASSSSTPTTSIRPSWTRRPPGRRSRSWDGPPPHRRPRA
jgi:hypothetical protein